MITVVAILFLVGCTAQVPVQQAAQNPQNNQNSPPPTEQQVVVTQSNNTQISPEITSPAASYSGKLLSTNVTPYLEFTQSDYDKAVADGKLIFLFFYGKDDPYSKIDDAQIRLAFNEMDYTTVVGFRVNYKDADTTADETAIANTFGINGPHTKIITKNGKMLRQPDDVRWLKNEVISFIGQQLQNTQS